MELIISSNFIVQFKFNYRNFTALDFIFKIHDYFSFLDKHPHELPTEYKFEKFKNELIKKRYYGIFYMKMTGINSKYAVSLKSLPTWVDQPQIDDLISFSDSFCKLNYVDYKIDKKYPVQILSSTNKSTQFSIQKPTLCSLSPYLYCYGENIPLVNEVKYKNYSIIIPFKNNIESTIRCVSSLIEKSSKKIKIEMILINHESHGIDDLLIKLDNILKNIKHIEIRILEFSGEFNFSKIVNFGVSEAKNEFIILCNNDVYMITNDWDEKLNRCVNLYPNNVWGITLLNGNKIDSIGVCFMNNLKPINLFEFQNKNILNNFKENKIIHTDAISGAFLCTSKKTFNDSGKFNEKLKVSLNDVAFCVLANSCGYNSTTILDIKAHHKRSLTRENDLNLSQRKRYFEEIKYSKNLFLKNKLLIQKKVNRFWSIPMRGFD